jgi:hypothetical protein
VAKFCILATKSKKASTTHTADFWGKFWLKVARFGQNKSESAAIFTQKVPAARQKFLKLPDSDKRLKHAAKISEIARFRQKLPPHCQISEGKNSEIARFLDNRFQHVTKI